MTFSSSSGFICPCPIATRQSGTCFSMSSFSSVSLAIRSQTKYTCPLRLISKLMASAITVTVEGNHLGLDRITVRWRCTHDAHIAGSHQRELQGTRNRSSTHGQGIHIHLQLAQLLLGRYTKLLLLINDQQSQVVPFH